MTVIPKSICNKENGVSERLVTVILLDLYLAQDLAFNPTGKQVDFSKARSNY